MKAYYNFIVVIFLCLLSCNKKPIVVDIDSAPSLNSYLKKMSKEYLGIGVHKEMEIICDSTIYPFNTSTSIDTLNIIAINRDSIHIGFMPNESSKQNHRKVNLRTVHLGIKDTTSIHEFISYEFSLTGGVGKLLYSLTYFTKLDSLSFTISEPYDDSGGCKLRFPDFWNTFYTLQFNSQK